MSKDLAMFSNDTISPDLWTQPVTRSRPGLKYESDLDGAGSDSAEVRLIYVASAEGIFSLGSSDLNLGF